MSPTILPDSIGTLPALLDKKQAAAYLQISAEGVDNLRRQGHLKAHKIGVLCRFAVSDLADYLHRSQESSFVRTPRARKSHQPAKSGNRGRRNKGITKRAA
jgi:excisionase family DNA binding protein